MKGLFLALMFPLAVFAGPETRKVSKVSDEWRKTYNFKPEHYALLRDNLDVVVDTHNILHYANLNAELRERLSEMQSAALQKIVNKGEALVPYLIREFANNVRDMNLDRSKEEKQIARVIKRHLEDRQDAIEASLTSIGLIAIPALADFHARAMRAQANLLTKRTKNLMSDIVKHSELDAEKTRVQLMVGETTKEEPAATTAPVAPSEPKPSNELNTEKQEPKATEQKTENVTAPSIY